MRSIYFRNTLSGVDSASYLPCEKPQKHDNFVVEITDIPDDVDVKEVQGLLNKTVVWKANVIEFSRLGEGKLVNGWGGPRHGAGRPSTGRQKKNFYITDEEHEKLKEYLETLREEE